MYLKNILFLVFVSFIFSCENNEVIINTDNLLLGTWVDPIYEGEKTTFKRASSLPNEGYGISFNQDGVFIERSSGWCGTPPLFYSDYEGTFNIDETLVKITTELYPTSFQWRIISVTETELIVSRELSEQEKDHRALMELYNEIYDLAYSQSCSDISDWTFTAYGAKACGGPQGFIPYSTKIDVVSFLQKIEAYTNAEKEFNIKWGIASDCAVINAPVKVGCKNGYPTLVY